MTYAMIEILDFWEFPKNSTSVLKAKCFPASGGVSALGLPVSVSESNFMSPV